MFGRWLVLASAVSAFALMAPSGAPPPGPEDASAASLPPGFEETIVLSGLTNPTVVRFADDGRVFVAEKSGLIKVFDDFSDATPTVFADMRTNVHNFWDRGLLGMTLHPDFPTTPYMYVLYTYDHVLGDAAPAPKWGTAGATSDSCPNPPGATGDGCVVSGRLSRLEAAGDVMTGSELVLVEDWCQQYPSHSTGAVEFGPDGALYASGGDGASFFFVDYGQDGNPLNPCGDPPGGAGAALTPPAAEGGALRTQDLRTSGDAVSLDGSIIRVDPATGAGLPTNPLVGSADANERRIIAYGMRNPFRFTFRPTTTELWIGDVGWNDWEEINRILDPSDSTVENFGWPCYEGNPRQPGYDAADLDICENLYGSGSADTKPFFAYHHSNKVVAGETCPTGSSSVSGLSFEFAPSGSPFPAEYQGALFFSDYSRDCIWVMRKNGNPIPSPGSIDTFVAGAENPVNIEFGADGNMYYVDFDGGTIRRVRPSPTTPPPTGTNYLSDLPWTSATNHCGPVEKDTSFGQCPLGDGATLTLNGVTFSKGLGAHAPSDISYYLGSNCTRFKASIGHDDEVPGSNGSITFMVYADLTKVYDSGVMNAASPTQTVDVSVSGASQLRLIVDAGDDASWDHADWALARVECGGGSDTTPPTVTGQAPSTGATGAALTSSPTATFSEAMNPATITSSTFTLVEQGTSTPVTASISYASQVATLDPSVDLEPLTTYTATVTGGASGVTDVAGNALASDVSWTFTTTGGAPQPPPAGTTYLSDLSWLTMANHCGPVELDRSNGNCGAGDGLTISMNGTTFAKGLGAHAPSDLTYYLGGTCARFQASVGIDDEVPASNGAVTFQVFADATLVYDSGSMNGTSPTQTIDVAVTGASQLRLVQDQGVDANWDHADWALARVECGGGDTSPPTLTGQTPTAGATEVAPTISPTATFSEAMDAATITSSTFTLVKQGTSTPLAASVSYSAQVATLDPSVDLEPGTGYTATVTGGASGVEDLAGNALASDASWAFTTQAAPNQPPTPVIDAPPTGTTWKVDDVVAFTGHATDPEDRSLASAALSWTLLVQHCPSNCHAHTIQSWPGVAGGLFDAPDHEYPTYLELNLTATDSDGASTTATLRLDPQTVLLSFASAPTGLQLAVNGTSSTTPFTRTVIIGSQNSLSAITPQSQGGTTYEFSSWTDGGAQTHNITAPASVATYTAAYSANASPPVNTVLPTISGQARVGRTLTANDGTWTGSQPMTFTYQWLRCTTTSISSCTAIPGGTAKTYLPIQADVGLRLRVTVTATNAAGSAGATSSQTSPVKRG